MASELIGAKDLARKLEQLDIGGKELRRVTFGASLPIVKEARNRIPVGTPPYENGKDPYPVKGYDGLLRTPGFAKRNIARKSFTSNDGTYVRIMVGVRPRAFYATQFVEVGTSRQAAQPWLRPALKNSKQDVVTKFGKQIKSFIKRNSK